MIYLIIFRLIYFSHGCRANLFLLDDPIIRRDYFISDNLVQKKKTTNMTLSDDTSHWMGNVLLCKYPMNELYAMNFSRKKPAGLKRGRKSIKKQDPAKILKLTKIF